MPYKDRNKQLQAQKEHYQRNKKKFANRTRKRRIERSKWFVDYKSQDHIVCKECNESHPACIAFHHRNPNDKNNGVSELVIFAYPVEVILEEIDKCDILCHNCHNKFHWENDNNRRYKQ